MASVVKTARNFPKRQSFVRALPLCAVAVATGQRSLIANQCGLRQQRAVVVNIKRKVAEVSLQIRFMTVNESKPLMTGRNDFLTRSKPEHGLYPGINGGGGHMPPLRLPVLRRRERR